MELKVYRLSAFPKEDHGGNPAGVIISADSLTVEEMQKIATEVGYSETAFVLNSPSADFKVRFFTPLSEVGLCGHATIATFNLLRDLGIITEGFYTQETQVGILKLEVKSNIVYMEQVPPVYGEYIDPLEINECFDNDEFINTVLPIRVLSTGMKEIFVPVKSVKDLNLLIPNIEKIIEISNKYDVIGIHCFAISEENDVDAYGTVSINGLRANAENQPDGTFAHDHAALKDAYVYSHYLGFLAAGEYVGGGVAKNGAEDVNWLWSASAHAGNLIIVRLK